MMSPEERTLLLTVSIVVRASITLKPLQQRTIADRRALDVLDAALAPFDQSAVHGKQLAGQKARLMPEDIAGLASGAAGDVLYQAHDASASTVAHPQHGE